MISLHRQTLLPVPSQFFARTTLLKKSVNSSQQLEQSEFMPKRSTTDSSCTHQTPAGYFGGAAFSLCRSKLDLAAKWEVLWTIRTARFTLPLTGWAGDFVHWNSERCSYWGLTFNFIQVSLGPVVIMIWLPLCSMLARIEYLT